MAGNQDAIGKRAEPLVSAAIRLMYTVSCPQQRKVIQCARYVSVISGRWNCPRVQSISGRDCERHVDIPGKYRPGARES
jgi:hypothetical protein